MLFFAHIPFLVNRAFSATPAAWLQQHPLLFTTNHTDHMFFVWRLHPTRPSHPGHSTILLRSESPSGTCTKPHTVAPSNNEDHTPLSLFAYASYSSIVHMLISAEITRCDPDMGRLQHSCNRLRLLATCSITNKQNYNVIDCDYIESNHNYNRDYICLETSSERKGNPFA